jgi:hypothetical protein
MSTEIDLPTHEASTEQPSAGPRERRPDPDFRPLVGRAVITAVVGWVVKVSVMIKVAADAGAGYEVKTLGPLPYLSFEVNRNTFTQITSKSTVVMVFAMLVLLVAGLLRNRSRIHVAGWSFGFLSMFWTVLVDLLLHRMTGQYTDMARMRWGIGAVILSALLLAWWVVVEKPHTRLTEWRDDDGTWELPAITT